MTRGRKETRITGERRCLASNETMAHEGMIRFVLSPDGVVTADLRETLDGRGVWVSSTKDALETVIKKNLFARGFKSPAKIPDNLIELIDARLVDSITSQISLMRRAKEAVAGADRVGEWLASGQAKMLLQARDGSPREKRNIGLRDLVKWHYEILDRHEMGRAFGRDNTVHIALTGNGLINRVYRDANRLSNLRKTDSE